MRGWLLFLVSLLYSSSQIVGSPDTSLGTIWATDAMLHPMYRSGITKDNLHGVDWVILETNEVSSLSTSSSGRVCAIAANTGDIMLRTDLNADWSIEPSDYELTAVACSDSETWALAGEQLLHRQEDDEQVGHFLWEIVESKPVHSLAICPASNTVWVTLEDGSVSFRAGISTEVPIGTHWNTVPGKLKSISCGPEGVWGISATTHSVVFRHDIAAESQLSGHWEDLGPQARQVSVSAHGVPFFIDHENKLWIRHGVSKSVPVGLNWERYPSGSLNQIGAGSLSLLVGTKSNFPLDTADVKLDGNWAKFGLGFAPPKIQRSGSLCILSGRVVGGVGDAVAHLPKLCRPSKILLFTVESGHGISQIQISKLGVLSLVQGFSDHSWLSLNGIAYEPSQQREYVEANDPWAFAMESYRHPMITRDFTGVCFGTGAFKGPIGVPVVGRIPDDCIPSSNRTFPVATSVGTAIVKLSQSGNIEISHIKSNELEIVIHLDGVIYIPDPTTPLRQIDRYQSTIDAAPTIQRVGQMCFLGGVAGSVSSDSGEIAVLPSYCRPEADQIFRVCSQDQTYRMDISRTGRVSVLAMDIGGHGNSSEPISIDGVFFHAHGTDVAATSPFLPVQEVLDTFHDWLPYRNGETAIVELSEEGYCILSGSVRSGSTSQIGRVPSQCTPEHTLIVAVLTSSGPQQLNITADGWMTLFSQSKQDEELPEWISLSGVLFFPFVDESIALSNGWKSAGSETRKVHLTEIGGLCILTGVATNPVSANEHIADVSMLCRPSKRISLVGSSQTGPCAIDISPNGQILVPNYHRGWISLDGITFSPHSNENLPLENDYSTQVEGFAESGVKKEGAVCILDGVVQGQTWGAIAKLPEYCHPSFGLDFSVSTSIGIGYIRIHPDGLVQLTSGVASWISLTGIVYDPYVDSRIIQVQDMSSQLSMNGKPTGDTCAQFRGGGYIRVPDSPVLEVADDMTIEFWFQAASTSAGMLLSHQHGIATFGVRWNGNQRPLDVFHLSQHQGNQSLHTGRWYHFAMVRKSQELRVFIDGRQDILAGLLSQDPCVPEITKKSCLAVSTSVCSFDELFGCFATPIAINSTSTDLLFGSAHFEGSLADVRLYDVALPLKLIKKRQAHRLHHKTPGLLANWQFSSRELLTADHLLGVPSGFVEGEGSAEFVNGGPGLDAVSSSGHTLVSSCISTEHGRMRFTHSDKIGFASSDTLTLEFWFYAYPSQSKQWLIYKGSQYGVYMDSLNQPIQFYDGSFHNSSKADFKAGAWYHIAVVDEGPDTGLLTLYIDGLKDQQVQRNPTRFELGPLNIGGLGSDYFHGRIADVRIWRLARSETDIRKYKNHRLLGSDPGLGAYIPFMKEENYLRDQTELFVEGSNRGIVTWMAEGPVFLDPLPLAENHYDFSASIQLEDEEGDDWTEWSSSIASPMVRFVADRSSSLGNRGYANVEDMTDLGGACEKAMKFTSGVTVGPSFEFQAGAGFKVNLTTANFDPNMYTLAILFKVNEVPTQASPILTTGDEVGLYLDGTSLVLYPGSKIVGSLPHPTVWTKFVIRHSPKETTITANEHTVYKGESVRGFDLSSKHFMLFAATSACGTSGTGGRLKEVDIFASCLIPSDLQQLMPQFSTRTSIVSGNKFIVANFTDFPIHQVSVCIDSRVSGPAVDSATLLSLFSYPGSNELTIGNPGRLSIETGLSAFPLDVSVEDNREHHVCAVVDKQAETMKLFFDGTLMLSLSVDPTPFSQHVSMVVGQNQKCFGGCMNPEAHWPGSIYAVKVWSTALSLEAVREDMERPRVNGTLSTDLSTDGTLLGVWVASTSGHEARNLIPSLEQLHISGMPMCPRNCSGHGECGFGNTCQCTDGYTGKDCSEGCPNACSLQGRCEENRCHCIPGFRGEDCSLRVDPNEDVLSDQCISIPVGHPLFCSMITHNIPSHLRGQALIDADDMAMQTFQRLSKFCSDGYGREIMKYAICGTFLLECQDDGKTKGVCASQCVEYEGLCNMTVSACNAPMYVGDKENCYTVYPAEGANETCARDCSKQGKCVKGACECYDGFSGGDCSLYDGDNIVIPSNLDFCRGIVNYSVPAVLIHSWSDTAAKRAFDILEPFCRDNIKGLTSLHHTLCATGFSQVRNGKVLKPCRSMCMDYGSQCGISAGLSCFSDFYSDDPHCFTLDYQQHYADAVMKAYGVEGAQAILHDTGHCPTNYTCVEGSCVEGSCVCTRGWFGHDCGMEIPTCPNYCSGHGICQDRLCKCLPGWQGDDCSTKTGMCDFDCQVDGWRTESCCSSISEILHPSLKKEEFVSPGCGKNCSGHGECSQFDTFRACECYAGYTGWDCSTREFCSNNCSGHGACRTSGLIPKLNRGPRNREAYYVVHEDVPDVRANFGNVLGDPTPLPVPRHPTVQEFPGAPNHLVIEEVYPEVNDIPATIQYELPNWTKDRSKCQCDFGFFGDDCSQNYVDLAYCPKNCTHNGHCIKNGVRAGPDPVLRHRNHTAVIQYKQLYRCVCSDGWFGERCSVAKQCPNHCSNNGKCKLGKCVCQDFYAGEDCSVHMPKCGTDFTCLNLGVCSASLQRCDCPPPYVGRECEKRSSEASCPNDFVCSNGGRCFEGRCLCPRGTYGYNCDADAANDIEPWKRGSRIHDIPQTPGQYRGFKRTHPDHTHHHH